MKTHLTCFLTGFLLFSSIEATESRPRAEIGKKAPDFTLQDATGRSHTLSLYEGYFVVLEWLNYDCPFVKKHYNSGNMQLLQERFGNREVIWFSIISSAPGKQGYLSPDQVVKFTREQRARPYAVLLDPEGQVGRIYDARVTPHMFIINPLGMLEYMGGIDDKPTTNTDDIPDARNFVRENLDLLLSGQGIEITEYQPYGCTIRY